MVHHINSKIGAFNMVPEVSETGLNSFHSFSLFYSSAFIFQLNYPSSASVILLLISSRVCLISVIVLFVTACLFCIYSRFLLNVLNEVCIFPFLFSRFGVIFNIITLNSLSGSLPIFSLCIWSCGFYLVPLSAR